MELLPGVVVCNTLEDSETLFQYLHGHGAVWASLDPLVKDGNCVFFSSEPPVAYEITIYESWREVFYFNLGMTDRYSYKFDDRDGQAAKEANLFWVSVDEYIDAHEHPEELDIAPILALL